MATEPQEPKGLTVDQLIVQLQTLSWTGKGHYRPTADGANGKTRFFTKSDFLVDNDSKTVDFHPHGDYCE
jgi:hypothetical protein